MIVTWAHARSIPWGNRVGYCVPGLRQFFTRHELDLKKFVQEGLDEKVFLQTGDAMAIRLVDYAREQEKV